MAQLKDLIVNGATQLIGDAVASNLKITTVVAPAAANSATYGMGTNGQVLHSTSSSVYWGDTVDAVTIVPSFTTGQKIADITIDGATTSIYAPEGTVQVNANWTATTGVASILNKPSIPSTYTDVGAASAGHTHTYSAVGAASAGHTHTYSAVGAASAAHVHGSITSDGKITATGVAIANGDGLVIVDSSDNNKIKKSSISFGNKAYEFLANDGTWSTPISDIILDHGEPPANPPSNLVDAFNSGTKCIYARYQYNQNSYILAPMTGYSISDSDQYSFYFGGQHDTILYSFIMNTDGVDTDWSISTNGISASAPSSQNDSTIPTAGAVYKLVIGAMRSSY